MACIGYVVDFSRYGHLCLYMCRLSPFEHQLLDLVCVSYRIYYVEGYVYKASNVVSVYMAAQNVPISVINKINPSIIMPQ